MASLIIGAAIALVALCLGACLLAQLRTARIENDGSLFTDKDLYAKGAAAAKEAKKNRPKTPDEQSAFERKLAEAGITLSASHWITRTALLAIILAALAYLACQNPLIALMALPAVYVANNLYLARALKKRRHLLDEQLSRALPQIASGIRTGMTLSRSVRVTASSTENPLRDELIRVAADAAYSTDIVEALFRMATRTGNEHVRKLASAVAIQEERGGAVAPTLMLIADSINTNLSAQREQRSEVAAMNITKWFVALALPAIFVFKWITDSSFVHFYTTEPLGWTVIAASIGFEIAGLLMSQKITRV